MAIQQLDPQQIRDWTLAEKDRWWFENVWRGDMPQLTVRAALSGMLIGGALSLTNLYVGAKTGWTLGVGVTSVILAFAVFKIFSSLGLGSEFTVLENNCMQSIATAAGYMTAPLVSSLAAYMVITNTIIPMDVTMIWIVMIALLGVLFAFPLKRRFINDEQHPFPEGRAAGIVMDALHTSDAREGLLKAKLLAVFGGVSALVKLMTSGAIMRSLHAGFLAIPGFLDEWIYRFWTPRIMGTELRQLTVRVEPDLIMFGAGGLMGIRVGTSLLIGALINYCILAPWMIARGDVVPNPEALAKGVTTYGFGQIVFWSLWPGVAVVTTASLLAFFAKPKVLLTAFTGLFSRKRNEDGDVLKHIELPMRVFVVGIPVVGAVLVFLTHRYFGVEYWHGIVAIPLIFVFTLIGVNSTALTSITPTGPLARLTQFTFAAIAPRNVTTNLISAGITAEVASNASNLLMDIKPGYMLGAKPRQQAIGHVLGIVAGAVVAVPVFYALFLGNTGPQGILDNEQYAFPAVRMWTAVAELLTSPSNRLPCSAWWAASIGAVVGIVLETLRLATKGRFWLSGVGVGLGFVIHFHTCLAMFAGALCFWLAERRWRDPESKPHKTIVKNQEPICAGLIAGGALMGILVALIETFMLGPSAP